jgi:hypothetical protein
MGSIENGVIRQLPDTRADRIFENFYQSPSYLLVSIANCPEVVLNRMVDLLDSEGISWLKPLQTYTSRELFFGQLDKEPHILPDLIFKKSRFTHSTYDTTSFRPGSAANEIKSNLLLDAIVQRQIKSGELSPPDGFSSLSVQVEQPLGVLVDKQHKSKYSIFYFESGFDLGEIIQYTDPPIQGAKNYNLRDWQIFCGIKDILDRIIWKASEEGLIMQDYDIHQVMYKVDENNQSLKIILIDSERFRMKDKE